MKHEENKFVQGLTEQEVIERRQRGQGNDVDFSTSRSYLQIVRYNVFTFVNIVLFIIGAALLALGLPQDAITTTGLAMMNALVGIVQEARAKYQLDKITLLTRPKVTIIREGQEKTVEQHEVVLGDLIVVHPGDQLICDGKIVENHRVEVDESLLTGESDTIPKQVGDKVLSGSFCVTGSAIYEATEVGKSSFANKLTARARDFKLTRTPLQSDVNKIVRWVGLMSVVIGAALYLNALRLDEPLENRVQMMAVVIGMIPQGLIFLITLAYGLGAVRIVGKGALVQRINAIESMSNVTILCLDKTGTLTTNKINFHSLYPYQIDEAKFKSLLGHFVASAGSSNRTSEAIGAAAKAEKLPVVEEVPFASSYKWSGLSFNHNGVQGTYILGAPEILQPALASYPPEFEAQMKAWSDKGLRVVMFAHRPEVIPMQNGKPELPAGLQPLGLISLSDELRPDADETLKNFADAGIQLKIISGDNPNTVASLARQAGFDTSAGIVSGIELEKMDAKQFAETAQKVSVFGRITPDQKENLVKALKEKGYYVAMIGDGVNDVLSLKQAHIGIAMQSGSTATRNVADIVLLNDSFAALPGVFVEGQKILNGMQDTIRLLLSRTFFVMLLVSAVTLVGKTFPFLPRHDALISFINAGLPPIFLAAWAKSGTPTRNMLGKAARFFIPAAVMLAIVGFGVYLYALENSGDLETARTVLVTVTIFCGMFLILFVKPPAPIFAVVEPVRQDKRPVLIVIALVAVYFALMLVDGLNDFFELVPLEAVEYAALAGISILWAGVLWIVLSISGRKAPPESLQ